MTKIEWAEKSKNFVIGCNEVSEACDNCYARGMHTRHIGNPKQPDYVHNFNVVVELPHRLEITWVKPVKIFVNSMSDTFNGKVSQEFIIKMFDLMNQHPQHIYEILTKRPKRALRMDREGKLNWHHGMWMGTTVELAKYYWRIDALREMSAPVKWLSLEPLLGPMDDIDLTGIDWVIVGGESGPKSKVRKMELDWVQDILDRCRDAGVPFFYKQSGLLQPCIGDHEGEKCEGAKGCKYFRGKLYHEYPGE